MNLPKFKLKLLTSGKEKIILAVILVFIVLIPTTSYVLSQITGTKGIKPISNFFPVTDTNDVPKKSALDELKDKLNKTSDTSSPTDGSGISDTASIILGPTLAFKLALEARPLTDQSTRLFLGIALGEATTKPKYLLSFTINLPASGAYKDLSLSGLDENVIYTAYFKGQAQIATSSSFMIKPNGNDLGVLNLNTGDVNEDNVINTADYSLVKASLGSNSSSQNWNANLDFNLDGVINTLDLSIVSRNLNKVGASGVWESGIPKAASESATLSGQLKPSVGGFNLPESNPKDGNGYWIWVPKISD